MATNGGFDRASFTRSLRQDIVKQKKKETAAPAGRIVIVTVENSAEYTVERLKAQTRWYGLRQVLEEPYTLWTKLISMVKAMTGTRKGNANKGKATSNIMCGMGQLASYMVASGTISVTELDDVFAIATKAVNMELGIGITELSHQFNNEGSAAAARAHLYRDTIDAIDLLVKDGYAGDGDERFAALSTAERRTLTRNFSEAKTAFAKMGTHFASVRVEAEAKRMHLDVASKDWLTWNEMIHFKAFVEGQAMELLHTHETNGALTMAQKTRFHGLFQAVVLFSLLGQRADVITGLTVQVMDAGKDAEAAARLLDEPVDDLLAIGTDEAWFFTATSSEKVPRLRHRNAYLSFGNGPAATFLMLSRAANKLGRFYIEQIREPLMEAWGEIGIDGYLFRMPGTSSPATASSVAKNTAYWIKICFGSPRNVSFRSLRRNFITLVVLLFNTRKAFKDFDSLADLKRALAAALNTSVQMLDRHYIAHSRYTTISDGAADTRLVRSITNLMARTPSETDRDDDEMRTMLTATERSFGAKRSSSDELLSILSSGEDQIGILEQENQQELDLGLATADELTTDAGGNMQAASDMDTDDESLIDSRKRRRTDTPLLNSGEKNKDKLYEYDDDEFDDPYAPTMGARGVGNPLNKTPRRTTNHSEAAGTSKRTAGPEPIAKKPAELFFQGYRVHPLTAPDGTVAGYMCNDPDAALPFITVEQFMSGGQE